MSKKKKKDRFQLITNHIWKLVVHIIKKIHSCYVLYRRIMEGKNTMYMKEKKICKRIKNLITYRDREKYSILNKDMRR